MFSGDEIVQQLRRMEITHVVWLPDSTLGGWEQALVGAEDLTLVRVCREGEAWGIATGLHLGGARPIVVIQCTGLFESCDSLRNAVYDYQLPLFAIIGYRSYLLPQATDSARTFTEPVLRTWQLPYRLLDTPDKLPELADHYRACRELSQPGVVLIAEGRM